MTHRNATESTRCQFCGGSDIHTAGCWSQRNKPEQCIGRRRVAGQTKTARCSADALPGKALCEVCAPGMCERHPAFEADNCPGRGTAAKI